MPSHHSHTMFLQSQFRLVQLQNWFFFSCLLYRNYALSLPILKLKHLNKNSKIIWSHRSTLFFNSTLWTREWVYSELSHLHSAHFIIVPVLLYANSRLLILDIWTGKQVNTNVDELLGDGVIAFCSYNFCSWQHLLQWWTEQAGCAIPLVFIPACKSLKGYISCAPFKIQYCLPPLTLHFFHLPIICCRPSIWFFYHVPLLFLIFKVYFLQVF